MDNKTYISQLSEVKVMADLAYKDYHIFNQISGKAPFDLVAYKENVLSRISAKSLKSTKSQCLLLILNKPLKVHPHP